MKSILERLADIGFNATQEAVQGYLKAKNLREDQIDDEKLFDMLQALEAPMTKQLAGGQKAIAPAAPLATTTGKGRKQAIDIVENATIRQQEEAAKLAAESANSNAAFMEKVRLKAAELDAKEEESDVLQGAQKLRQVRKATRNQTLDFLESMMSGTTSASIRNIQTATEVMDAEVVA